MEGMGMGWGGSCSFWCDSTFVINKILFFQDLLWQIVCFSLCLLSRFISGNPTLGSVVFNMECQGFKKLKLGFHSRLLSGWVWFGSSRGNNHTFIVRCAQLFENLVSNSLLNLETTSGELVKTQLQPNPKCGVELIRHFQRPPPPLLCQ